MKRPVRRVEGLVDLPAGIDQVRRRHPGGAVQPGVERAAAGRARGEVQHDQGILLNLTQLGCLLLLALKCLEILVKRGFRVS